MPNSYTKRNFQQKQHVNGQKLRRQLHYCDLLWSCCTASPQQIHNSLTLTHSRRRLAIE